jgi:hypothetical protein
MKKFLLKFSDSLLSKEEIRSVKGGYDGGGGGTGGGYPPAVHYLIYCANPYGGPSSTISGTSYGSCPDFYTANNWCKATYPGTVESNMYCS